MRSLKAHSRAAELQLAGRRRRGRAAGSPPRSRAALARAGYPGAPERAAEHEGERRRDRRGRRAIATASSVSARRRSLASGRKYSSPARRAATIARAAESPGRQGIQRLLAQRDQSFVDRPRLTPAADTTHADRGVGEEIGTADVTPVLHRPRTPPRGTLRGHLRPRGRSRAGSEGHHDAPARPGYAARARQGRARTGRRPPRRRGSRRACSAACGGIADRLLGLAERGGFAVMAGQARQNALVAARRAARAPAATRRCRRRRRVVGISS